MLLINNVKILHNMVLCISTNNKDYIIDVAKLKQEEFNKLKIDYDMFVNNLSYDIYGVYWTPTTDISIDELDHFEEIINHD